jgi:predicted Zn-ribbon and HTH transcriptional regulator
MDSHSLLSTDDLRSTLEQRADYLPIDEISSGTALNDFFENVHRALTERGTKLVVGPRGCGKTHMMRYTWVTCRDDSQAPLCIYVSFNRYYRLEPLLKARPNAIDLFHSWVLARILLELIATVEAVKTNVAASPEELVGFSPSALIGLVTKLERSLPLSAAEEDLTRELSIERARAIIVRAIERFQRKRAVLLLDDAALTLTPEYLYEFFDIVRSIKTPTISPKASVYPGTTEYGPRFHANQEGEIVPLWLAVEDANYSSAMQAIAEKRFPSLHTVPAEVNDYLKYAAFGIPRAYLTMLSEFSRGGFTTTQQGLNRIIQNHASARIDEFRSLAVKAPRFATLIARGEEVYRLLVRDLKEFNDTLMGRNEKQLTIGISGTDEHSMVIRLFNLLVEAGLLYPHPQVSHGHDRSYLRFTPHLSSLFEARAFSGGERGSSPKQIVEILQSKSSKHPLRRSVASLFPTGQLELLRLDMPPCKKCGYARVTESQRFCHNCGSELLDESTFTKCMALPLTAVPGLTEWQRERIAAELPHLRTIGDLLAIQDPGTELRKIHRVGQRRATRIVEVTEGYVEEFLS